MRTLLASLVVLGSVAMARADRPAEPPTVKGRVAIAIVYNGAEVWLGNASFEPADSPARYPGILSGLVGAHSVLANVAPAGSELALVTYTDVVRVRQQLKTLTPANPYGEEADYKHAIGSELVMGVQQGLELLEASPAPNKHLIVLGDGNDTNNETAPKRLAALAQRAADANIGIKAIVFKGELSSPENAVTALDPQTVTVNNATGIETALAQYIGQHAQRPVVNKVAPPTPEAAAPAKSGWLGWWPQLAIGLGLVLVLVVIARLRGRTNA